MLPKHGKRKDNAKKTAHYLASVVPTSFCSATAIVAISFNRSISSRLLGISPIEHWNIQEPRTLGTSNHTRGVQLGSTDDRSGRYFDMSRLQLQVAGYPPVLSTLHSIPSHSPGSCDLYGIPKPRANNAAAKWVSRTGLPAFTGLRGNAAEYRGRET